jgi:biotin carboxyl carrier protein
MKKIIKTIITLIIIAAIVIVAVKTLKKRRAAEAQLPAAKAYTLVVPTFTPAKKSVTLTLPYIAESLNDQDVILTTKISARVEMIKTSGTKVKKGDIVARLDTTDLKATIDNLKEQIGAQRIALNTLLQTHRRTQELYNVKGASVEQLQNENAKIASLKAAIQNLQVKLNAAKHNLSYAEISAPTNGVISKSFASSGSVAMPGKPLLQISAEKGTSLIVRLPDTIRPQAVRYKGTYLPLVALDTTFHGLREYKAYINDQSLNSHERVEIDVVLFQGEGILLPFETVLDREGKSYLFEIAQNRATPKAIAVSQIGQEGILTEDETIVGKKIAAGAPDILLKLLSGAPVKSEE